MAKEHTDLDDLLEIEVLDMNNEETTVGNLIDELTNEEKETLRNNINPANEILNWELIDSMVCSGKKLPENTRSYMVGAIYNKEYEGRDDPKYYQKTKHWLLDMSDKELLEKSYEVGLAY